MGTTTVDIQFPDGMSTGPIDVDDLDAAAKRLRDQEAPQLTFFVGGATPDIQQLALAGKLGITKQLAKGAEIKVQVIDDTGEVIAEADAIVEALTFKDKRDEFGNVTETLRLHSAKVS